MGHRHPRRGRLPRGDGPPRRGDGEGKVEAQVITGAHSIIYSRKPGADRAFLRDVLRLPHVDAGEGWLIFGLPPAELAVHPSRKNDLHEFYVTCKDARAFVAAMARRSVRCSPVQNMGWGLLTRVSLPGGGTLGVYEPRHARPKGARQRRRPESGRRTKRKIGEGS